MAGITLPRDQIFRGWKEGQTSRVVGNIGKQNSWWKEDEDPRIEELRKWIAQHHTSEVQESYFYSVRTVCPLDIAREKHEIRAKPQRLLAILIGIGVSLLVYWATRSYFESAWKVCQAIADKKEYVAADPVFPLFLHRYATAEDIWNQHPTAGAPWLLFFRTIFCWSFPLWALFGCEYLVIKTEPRGKRDYHLILDRSKDERICPSNFDIQKDCDPLTQEAISIQKLHSPQMIYLPNYVTEAKSFVSALLLAGKKDFTDPVYRRKFTVEERQQILSQIERIFQISESMFNKCFSNESDSELPLELIDFRRYVRDKRVFDERGQFSREAASSLQEVFGEETRALNNEIDRYANQLPDLQQRETVRRVIKVNALAISGYINNLQEDDKASWRIHFFEKATGVSLRAPSAE